MKVTITGPVTHLCPFVDEVDVGTVELTYDSEGSIIELHALRAFLASFHSGEWTHEQVTERIAAEYPDAHVRTCWRTAGLDIECEA